MSSAEDQRALVADISDTRVRSAVRHIRLREILSTRESVDSEALAAELKVSESTIRRDLIELEKQGYLRRVYGGALSLQVRDEQLDLGRLSTIAPAEKERIGQTAASLISDGQIVMLAPGTTVLEVAKRLVKRNLQVVTNSVPVAQAFWDCKNVEVIMTGGYLYPRIGVLLGPVCDQMLDTMSAEVLVMGIAGITEDGMSDSNMLIMGTMRKMMERAKRVILVADHTKFGRRSLVHIAPLTDVDCVVTDAPLDPKYRRLLEVLDVECILA